MDEAGLRRNNYWTFLLEGVTFVCATAFLDANAVIPVFIYGYSSSLQLAGLAATLCVAFPIIAQVIVGPFVDRLPNLPAYITRVMFLSRPLPLLMVPVLLGGLPAWATVLIFLVLYSLLWAGDGLVTVPWADLLARTIRPALRGHLLGMQQLVGGLGGLAAGYVIKAVLASPALTDAQRFSVLFGSAGLLLLVASVFFAFTRDLPRQPSTHRVHPIDYYRQIPRYFTGNRDFMKMAVVRVFASVATMVSPLIILFGKTTLGLSDARVSTLIYVQIVGNLLGGALWGNISRRAGNKAVIAGGQVVSLLVPALALGCLAWPGSALASGLLTAAVFINGTLKGNWLGFINYTMDLSCDSDRTVYLLLNSLIPFPLTFLSYLAGVVADGWGFAPLFVISAIGSVVAAVLSFRLRAFPYEGEG